MSQCISADLLKRATNTYMRMDTLADRLMRVAALRYCDGFEPDSVERAIEQSWWNQLHNERERWDKYEPWLQFAVIRQLRFYRDGYFGSEETTASTNNVLNEAGCRAAQ